MTSEAMKPLGLALIDYMAGKTEAEVNVCREDGFESKMPIGIFFRTEAHFLQMEARALELCKGRILDAGAGAGCHTLTLQEKGLDVTAIDIVPEAVEVMKKRGVEKTFCSDVLTYDSGPFDTILFMMNGIGIVETLKGLDKLLLKIPNLLNTGGQVLLDSTDLRKALSDDLDIAYLDSLEAKGRYCGETKYYMQYKNTKGSAFGTLFIDADMLKNNVEKAGLQFEIIFENNLGQYLGKITV